MSTLRANTILAASGLAADPVAIPGLDKRFATAWVNFNGTGVVAIRSAYNVASITDNGVGSYALNFTTPLAGANYAVVGAATVTSVADLRICAAPQGTTTATPLGVIAGASGAASDAAYISAAIFGGQA